MRKARLVCTGEIDYWWRPVSLIHAYEFQACTSLSLFILIKARTHPVTVRPHDTLWLYTDLGRQTPHCSCVCGYVHKRQLFLMHQPIPCHSTDSNAKAVIQKKLVWNHSDQKTDSKRVQKSWWWLLLSSDLCQATNSCTWSPSKVPQTTTPITH